MILVDSLYINESGGLRLLEYLTDTLYKKNIEFFLLADTRCMGRFDRFEHVRYMKASLWERKRYYNKYGKCFSSVLCFGNLPTPIKMQVPVYTYFHNINLLTLSEAHSKKEYITMWLKRQVFRLFKSNTDVWLVQSTNTANELCYHLRETEERVKLMPFFELSDKLIASKEKMHSSDYVYIANYTKAKGHEELLDAWQLLHEQGVDQTLHLTVKDNNKQFVEKIRQAQQRGVQVVNHGVVPFNEVIELYQKAKAIIYPSHNESLGLGIIEAITAGCDVIGADLPYIHAVCEPSGVFNPYSPEAIADAIMEYEKGGNQKSILFVSNQIDELIDLLTESE